MRRFNFERLYEVYLFSREYGYTVCFVITKLKLFVLFSDLCVGCSLTNPDALLLVC